MNDLQLLLRSRSLSLLLNRGKRRFSKNLSSFKFKGRPLFYRPGSSDIINIQQLLLRENKESEYFIPKALNPLVILDIGANTGISTVSLATRFPAAKILAFEPVPDNFSILLKNIEPFRNIQAFQIALGPFDGKLTLKTPADARDFVGYSQYGFGETSGDLTVNVRSPSSLLEEIHIDRIDLIKIDAEGTEYDILTALDPKMLAQVHWIAGELHGIKDWILLEHLSKDFYLEIKKTFWCRMSKFYACNKKIIIKVSDDANPRRLEL